MPNGLDFDGVDDRAFGPILPAIPNGVTVIAVASTTKTGVQQQTVDNKTAGSNLAGFALEINASNGSHFRVANGAAQVERA